MNINVIDIFLFNPTKNGIDTFILQLYLLNYQLIKVCFNLLKLVGVFSIKTYQKHCRFTPITNRPTHFFSMFR